MPKSSSTYSWTTNQTSVPTVTSILISAPHRPPPLEVWGKNGPFFVPAVAEAFRRDIPDAEIRLFDTGHFALETHALEIAKVVTDFLTRKVPKHT